MWTTVKNKILADSNGDSSLPDGVERKECEGLYSGPAWKYQESAQGTVRRKNRSCGR
jgi:hypothetical protein